MNKSRFGTIAEMSQKDFFEVAEPLVVIKTKGIRLLGWEES